MTTYAKWLDAGIIEVSVECSRCKRTIRGFENALGTAGFYRLAGPWAKYGRNDETILCDSCMWNSEEYKMDYALPCQHFGQKAT